MDVRYNQEPYDVWINQVAAYELVRARKQLDQSVPLDEILENLARNIIEKNLYPLIQDVKNVASSTYNREQCLQEYQTNYLDKTSRSADHMTRE